MSEDHDKIPEGLKKADKILDKGFRLLEWALLVFFIAVVGYVAFLILGFLEKPALMQWGGAAIIGVVGGWLIMKILKVLSWFGFG